jgi:hypothetical protein
MRLRGLSSCCKKEKINKNKNKKMGRESKSRSW